MDDASPLPQRKTETEGSRRVSTSGIAMENPLRSPDWFGSGGGFGPVPIRLSCFKISTMNRTIGVLDCFGGLGAKILELWDFHRDCLVENVVI